MPDEQPFYHVLADVYDLLFPVTAEQRRFFADLVNDTMLCARSMWRAAAAAKRPCSATLGSRSVRSNTTRR